MVQAATTTSSSPGFEIKLRRKQGLCYRASGSRTAGSSQQGIRCRGGARRGTIRSGQATTAGVSRAGSAFNIGRAHSRSLVGTDITTEIVTVHEYVSSFGAGLQKDELTQDAALLQNHLRPRLHHPVCHLWCYSTDAGSRWLRDHISLRGCVAARSCPRRGSPPHFAGASTTITLTPNVVRYTIYPTETSFDTSTVTEAITLVQTRTDTIISNEATTVVRVETTTVVEDDPEPTPFPEDPSPSNVVTATSTSDEPEPTTTRWIDAEPTRPPWASDEVQSRCWKGDNKEKVPGLFNLTPDQVITLCESGSVEAFCECRAETDGSPCSRQTSSVSVGVLNSSVHLLAG